MATSPAPRPRSCSPGRARTGASSCAPASPSPGPTRSACCEYGAPPALHAPAPGLASPARPDTRDARPHSERGSQFGCSRGPSTETGASVSRTQGPACPPPRMVGGRSRGPLWACWPRSSGFAVLELSGITLRPGHTPQQARSCGTRVSLASRGQEKRSGLFEAGGSSGLHDGGCVEGSLVTRVLVRDAQCGYPHGRAGVAGGDPSRAWASGLRGPGGSRSRRSHRHGVGSLKKGLSVHPEAAFGAL